jgi:hypothetical protein
VKGGTKVTDIERLFRNLKIFIEAGVLDEEFAVFIQDYPNCESIGELNEIMGDEMSYWEE